MTRHLAETARVVLDHALSQPPLLGGGRLICIDGPSGSGKTTLADAVARAALARVATVHVLHTDDLLDGWSGLPRLGPRLRNDVVGPLASGHPARYRRYDWIEERYAEEHVVAPMDLLVLEGVGAGFGGIASRRACLVWADAPDALRLARGVARDGIALRDHLLAWMADEEQHYRVHGTKEQADVLVDEVGRVTGRS